MTGPDEPTVNITSRVTEIKSGHVWTDKGGNTNGSLDLGATWITFHSPQQAREAAAALTELAGAMEAHAAGQEPASADPERVRDGAR